MIKVFTAGGREASRLGGSWAGLIAILIFYPSLSLQPAARAQTPKDADPATAKEKSETPPAAEAKVEGAKDEAVDENKPVEDPSETQKGASVELMLDPNAVELLDLKNFSPIRASRDATAADMAQFKRMPGDPLVPVDPRIITSVVDTMIGQLTNHKNIEAVLDTGGANPNAAAARAIQEATQALLEPIFLARAAKNVQFQAAYNRILAQRLAPVLKNHLIPRIQAMIILGQSANVDAYKIFLDEIKNPTQTVWVKHWAFRGLTNIKQFTNKLSASQEIDASKMIADQLAKNTKWPWPVQFRGLEAMAVLRQGYSPTSPRTADMAAAAFQYLTDESLRPEVRAEAALALGMMQMATVVPKYNQVVVGYAAARLAAEIGDRVATGFSENNLRAQKLTTIMMGPILQAYEGQAGLRESGILNSPVSTNVKADIQKYLDAVKPVVKAAVELVSGPIGQAKARTEDLKAQVATLRAFLDKNPPASGELFQGGPKLPDPGAKVAADEPKPGDGEDAPDKTKGEPEKAASTAKSRGNR